MERRNDLLRRLQDVEALRRLQIERGEVKIEPAEPGKSDARWEKFRKILQKNPRGGRLT